MFPLIGDHVIFEGSFATDRALSTLASRSEQSHDNEMPTNQTVVGNGIQTPGEDSRRKCRAKEKEKKQTLTTEYAQIHTASSTAFARFCLISFPNPSIQRPFFLLPANNYCCQRCRFGLDRGHDDDNKNKGNGDRNFPLHRLSL